MLNSESTLLLKQLLVTPEEDGLESMPLPAPEDDGLDPRPLETPEDDGLEPITVGPAPVPVPSKGISRNDPPCFGGVMALPCGGKGVSKND